MPRPCVAVADGRGRTISTHVNGAQFGSWSILRALLELLLCYLLTISAFSIMAMPPRSASLPFTVMLLPQYSAS